LETSVSLVLKMKSRFHRTFYDFHKNIGPSRAVSLRLAALGSLLVACLCFAGEARADDSLYELDTAGAQRTEKLPLILLLHGATGAPQSMARLLQNLPVRARVVAPHGLFAAGGGWAWYPMREGMTAEERVRGITKAADVLVKLLDDLLKARPTCGRPIVVGFSQGGVVSYALAARSPAVVAAAFPVSGYLPRPLVPTTKPANAARIEAFHGDADEIIPVDLDRDASAALTQVGFQSSLKVYPGVGHVAVEAAAGDLIASVVRTLREMGCVK
jgi:phospholipase/carboxylesterase